ncbi:MAG: aspartate aminotransferase family protein, partial [Candidatus Bathyarchaeia archaeon]
GGVYQAGTFSGNPLSVAAGYATVKFLAENRGQVYPELERNCTTLRKALEDLSQSHGLEVKVNSLASMFQIFFTRQDVVDYSTAKLSDTRKFYRYFTELLKNGIFVPPSQFETCFLSTAHSGEDLELTIEAFDKALAAAAKG